MLLSKELIHPQIHLSKHMKVESMINVKWNVPWYKTAPAKLTKEVGRLIIRRPWLLTLGRLQKNQNFYNYGLQNSEGGINLVEANIPETNAEKKAHCGVIPWKEKIKSITGKTYLLRSLFIDNLRRKLNESLFPAQDCTHDKIVSHDMPPLLKKMKQIRSWIFVLNNRPAPL